MNFSRVAVNLGIAVLALGVGIGIGRSQSGDVKMLQGEGVEEHLVSILHLQEPLVRARALTDFFSQQNPTHLEIIEAVYTQERPQVDEVAEVLFAAWWARFDPAGAFGGRIPPNWGGDDPWSRTVMLEWVRKDPQTALAAALALPPKPESVKLESLRSVIKGWFDHPQTDPNDLLAIIDQVTEVRPRGELVILWVSRMIETRGVDYAIDYAESMPEDPYELRTKRELMGRLAAQLIPVNSERAVEFTERNAGTPAGNKTATYMINRWAHDDGPAAFVWALATDVPQKHKVVERAWRAFLIGDREAALSWMSMQSYSKPLEPAYSLYLMNLAKKDHQRALELSTQIEDPSSLIQVWQSVGRSWIAKDPIGAEAWMMGLDLPPEVVRNIRARKPDPIRGRINPGG